MGTWIEIMIDLPPSLQTTRRALMGTWIEINNMHFDYLHLLSCPHGHVD